MMDRLKSGDVVLKVDQEKVHITDPKISRDIFDHIHVNKHGECITDDKLQTISKTNKNHHPLFGPQIESDGNTNFEIVNRSRAPRPAFYQYYGFYMEQVPEATTRKVFVSTFMF